MPRAVTLGNGHMLVGLDDRARVRDLYYPFVGLENHVSGASGSYTHRIGVWVDGQLSWLDHDGWNIDISAPSDAAMGHVIAVNESLGVSLGIEDVLYNEKDVFIRKMIVTNMIDRSREIKVYVAHQFRIAEGGRGGTGFYDPRAHAIIHYKHHYVFLANAASEAGNPFDDYTVGIFGIEGKEGSHHDAEDGVLTKNPIEHGSVDSVLGMSCSLEANEHKGFYYWLIAGSSIEDAHEINKYIIEETPARVHKSTISYWNAWINKHSCDLTSLPEHLKDLYNKSLFVVRAHCDDEGAIIASSDSDMLNGGRDTYSYMWPRDASISARSLDSAGYTYITRSFYQFCTRALTPDGYFMHKYCADGSLGSSWHPWMYDGKEQLPIQLDETALVLYNLGKHYECAEDLEFVESIYNSFIERAARFLCSYRSEETGLPMDTYDLWEEKYGSSTYSAAAACGALRAASQFAEMLGKAEDAKQYADVAASVRQAILTHLYDESLGMFRKLLRHDATQERFDNTIDMSSFHGIVAFDVLPIGDSRVLQSYETVIERLRVPGKVGGIMRYEGDNYYRIHDDATPNPWFITTLWLAQYQIAVAQSMADLEVAKQWLEWTCSHAHNTGVLSEQLNPYTGEHISTAPLTWSHAEYVLTVNAYTEKVRQLGG